MMQSVRAMKDGANPSIKKKKKKTGKVKTMTKLILLQAKQPRLVLFWHIKGRSWRRRDAEYQTAQIFLFVYERKID